MRHLVLIACLAAAHTAAAAGAPDFYTAGAKYRCSFSANLHGDGVFYMTYGRDSWHGSADLACTSSNGEIVHRPVEINYNATASGVGVTQTSALHIEGNLATASAIPDLNILAHVFNSGGVTGGTQFVWTAESGLSTVTIRVLDPIPAGVGGSLQEGSLYIR